MRLLSQGFFHSVSYVICLSGFIEYGIFENWGKLFLNFSLTSVLLTIKYKRNCKSLFLKPSRGYKCINALEAILSFFLTAKDIYFSIYSLVEKWMNFPNFLRGIIFNFFQFFFLERFYLLSGQGVLGTFASMFLFHFYYNLFGF